MHQSKSGLTSRLTKTWRTWDRNTQSNSSTRPYEQVRRLKLPHGISYTRSSKCDHPCIAVCNTLVLCRCMGLGNLVERWYWPLRGRIIEEVGNAEMVVIIVSIGRFSRHKYAELLSAGCCSLCNDRMVWRTLLHAETLEKGQMY